MVSLPDIPHELFLDDEHMARFSGWCLLKRLAGDDMALPVNSVGEDATLAPIAAHLLERGFVSMTDTHEGKVYEVSLDGQRELARLEERYGEIISAYDVYCAVDLEEWKFAYQDYHDMTDAEWREHLERDCWDDLRLTVAEYQGQDLAELVFLGLLHDARFMAERGDWKSALGSGEWADEIEEICQRRVRLEELAYESDEGPVSGREVMEDLIADGERLAAELRRQEREQYGNGHGSGEEE